MSHSTPSLEELYRAHGEGWRRFIGAAERGESWEAPGVSVGIGGELSANLNWIVAYGPDGLADGIASAAAVVRRRTLPACLYAASPVAAEVAGIARDLGFAPGGHLPFMCVHATDVVSCCEEHKTVRVDGMEGILAAGDILADAFDLPVDWCQRLLGVGFARLPDAGAHLALHDGRPVAVAGSATFEAVGNFYAVGTRTTHRGRGAGAAAMTAAVGHQLEAGARWLALLSSPGAERFYAGLGFVAVDHPSVWVLQPE
jgi:GNAT superfamily N-acetyltransferase